MIKLIHLLEGKYDYGCIMACVDEHSTSKILEFNYKTISEDIIYKEGNDCGREHHPHITIKYGLIESYTEEQMKGMLHTVIPFDVQIKGIGVFENDKFDVIKLEVDGKGLRILNELFNKLPNHDAHPTYQPHLTLGYVKKGTGKKFVKPVSKFARIPVKTLEYSDRGEKTYYNLCQV